MEIVRENPKPALIVALIVIVFVGFNLFRADKPPEFVQKGLSKFMGYQEEQVALLADVLPEGSKVVVFDLDRVALGYEKKEIKRVTKAIEQAGVNIVHSESVMKDDTRGWNFERGGFPYLEFLRMAETYPDIDAVISLCGLPYFDGVTHSVDPMKLPKLLTTSGIAEDEKAEALFHEGWLHAVTVTREEPVGDRTEWVYELLVVE